MQFDSEWATVIGEALRWVREIRASKRQNTLEVADLSRRLDELAYGNAALAARQTELLAAVLSELARISIVNHGSILILRETPSQNGRYDALDDGTATQEQLQAPSHGETGSALPPTPSYFDGVDAEIARARLTRPSERE